MNRLLDQLSELECEQWKMGFSHAHTPSKQTEPKDHLNEFAKPKVTIMQKEFILEELARLDLVMHDLDYQCSRIANGEESEMWDTLDFDNWESLSRTCMHVQNNIKILLGE